MCSEPNPRAHLLQVNHLPRQDYKHSLELPDRSIPQKSFIPFDLKQLLDARRESVGHTQRFMRAKQGTPQQQNKYLRREVAQHLTKCSQCLPRNTRLRYTY